MTPIEKVPLDWMEHGFTEKLRRHLADQQKNALAALISECRQSSDPKVTRRLAAYEEIASFLGQLARERSDGRADGDD